MPIFDFGCVCGQEVTDRLAKAEEQPPCPTCGEPMAHLWRSNVVMIDDTCDMTVENLGPTPMHFDSKTRWRETMAAMGKVNRVQHTPVPGSDKSPVTQRWV